MNIVVKMGVFFRESKDIYSILITYLVVREFGYMRDHLLIDS